MIIVKLKGGLGNQLFQYAAGRALALRQQKIGIQETGLKLDTTAYSRQTSGEIARRYSLSFFNIKAEIASDDEITKNKYPYGLVSKARKFIQIKILREFNVVFHKYIFDTKKSLYLDGFFQTERYFIDQEKEIREDLTLKNSLGPAAQKSLDLIKGIQNSVSLHVRRGDYVHDAYTSQYNGSCGPEYYAKALELMTTKIGTDIHIFVFSDEISWVKDNMPLPYPATYVSAIEDQDPAIKDYEELMLMSACQHNIIANSSFSWWGAWLNRNPNKIIIAPSRWVLQGPQNHKDTVPSSWIKI